MVTTYGTMRFDLTAAANNITEGPAPLSVSCFRNSRQKLCHVGRYDRWKYIISADKTSRMRPSGPRTGSKFLPKRCTLQKWRDMWEIPGSNQVRAWMAVQRVKSPRRIANFYFFFFRCRQGKGPSRTCRLLAWTFGVRSFDDM